VSLAADRRARVPFALVGVLLLVGSATLSASLAGGPSPRIDDSVGATMDRTTAATNTALREAVASAGRRAASDPVTTPANTTAGRVLNDSTPYRDLLRIRVSLAAREALDSVTVQAGDVEGTASLPPISNASELRAAKRRVRIEPVEADENGGLRVRIENVTVTAERDGRTVERERISPTLAVATPALALHERTERFEDRLNRGPLEPGLGRRLTARTYAVAWARGYAQYGRAPIENVVANRHVELATNGALLREQRTVFGQSDPRGRRALAWATARTGATDLLEATHNRRGTKRTKLLLTAANRYREANPMPGGVTDAEDGPTGARLRVGVNRTADRAFADLVRGENGTSLTGLLRSAYTVEARVVAAVQKTEAEDRPAPEPPNETDSNQTDELDANRTGESDSDWTLRDTSVETTTRVERQAGESDSPPRTGSGWHVFGHESRRVVQVHSLVANWSRGNESRRTVQRWTETYQVRVGVAGDHSATAASDWPSNSDRPSIPDRPVVGVHEQGGPLDGPNLRDVPMTASERLVEDRGGFDALARRAVHGTLDTRPEQVTGRRPSELREWVYGDLVALRERVRNVSVTTPPHSVLDGRSPAGKLARTIRANREAFVDAPESYDGVADRARVATRAAYLDRVLTRLDERGDRTNATRAGVDGVLGDAGVSLDRAQRVLRERTTPGTPEPDVIPADGPGRPVELQVSGGPPYLTLAALEGARVEGIPDGEERQPLAARNVNAFAVPYSDLAGAMGSALGEDSSRADLRTAALALRAANRTLDERENETLARQRDELRASLAASMADVREGLVAELAMRRFDLSSAERRTAVVRGLARWDATHARALAVANGSVADAIAAAVVRQRPSLRRADRRDWVRLRTELAVESAGRSVDGPLQSAVNRTGTTARRIASRVAQKVLDDALENAAERASDRWFGEVLGSVPAGLPVAPVPGYWYATVNVWTVSVRGEYAHFSVRAPQGPPGDSVVYSRESGVVELDVDGDGRDERLGRTDPVSFETETAVVVVVPPGPPGVGDRDGTRDEQSPGWNLPEPLQGWNRQEPSPGNRVARIALGETVRRWRARARPRGAPQPREG
jgi:hypothetical protein